MLRSDLSEIVAIEELCNTYWDEDFGLLNRSNQWTRQDFYKAGKTKTFRCYVCEGPNLNGNLQLFGGYVVELEDDCVNILKITAIDEETEELILGRLTAQADSGSARKKIFFVASDGDWETLKVYQKYGFKARLASGLYGKEDGWLLTYGGERKATKPLDCP
jgi:hypothetical protein